MNIFVAGPAVAGPLARSATNKPAAAASRRLETEQAASDALEAAVSKGAPTAGYLPPPNTVEALMPLGAVAPTL